MNLEGERLEKTNFANYVGKKHDFYGVYNNEFKLGDIVFEAMENADDGYRSHLGNIEVKNSDGIFFKEPIANVIIRQVDRGYCFEGYELVDSEDAHIWLGMGTNRDDSYYPCFIFNYTPKGQEFLIPREPK